MDLHVTLTKYLTRYSLVQKFIEVKNEMEKKKNLKVFLSPLVW